MRRPMRPGCSLWNETNRWWLDLPTEAGALRKTAEVELDEDALLDEELEDEDAERRRLRSALRLCRCCPRLSPRRL